VTMTDPDRAKLQVAAVIGAVLGIVTCYVVGSGWIGILLCKLIGATAPLLVTWLEADGSPYFSMRSLARSSSAGRSINFGLFVSECPPFAASRRRGRSRNKLLELLRFSGASKQSIVLNSQAFIYATEYGSVVGDICVMEAPMRDAITGIGLVAFGAIAVLAVCIGVCALADAVIRVVA